MERNELISCLLLDTSKSGMCFEWKQAPMKYFIIENQQIRPILLLEPSQSELLVAGN
jgi:hypothetical protein